MDLKTRVQLADDYLFKMLLNQVAVKASMEVMRTEATTPGTYPLNIINLAKRMLSDDLSNIAKIARIMASDDSVNTLVEYQTDPETQAITLAILDETNLTNAVIVILLELDQIFGW